MNMADKNVFLKGKLKPKNQGNKHNGIIDYDEELRSVKKIADLSAQ